MFISTQRNADLFCFDRSLLLFNQWLFHILVHISLIANLPTPGCDSTAVKLTAVTACKNMLISIPIVFPTMLSIYSLTKVWIEASIVFNFEVHPIELSWSLLSCSSHASDGNDRLVVLRVSFKTIIDCIASSRLLSKYRSKDDNIKQIPDFYILINIWSQLILLYLFNY